METAIIIYLYFTVMSILDTCLFILGAILLGFLLRGIAYAAIEDKWPDKDSLVSKGIKRIGIPFIVILMIHTFLPSLTTIKYMIGGTAVMAASELDGIEKLPQNVIDLANEFLEATKEEPIEE